MCNASYSRFGRDLPVNPSVASTGLSLDSPLYFFPNFFPFPPNFFALLPTFPRPFPPAPPFCPGLTTLASQLRTRRTPVPKHFFPTLQGLTP